MKKGKWRNEEMETHVHTEPWILAEIMEIDRQSRQDAWLIVGSLACKTTQLVNGWHLQPSA